MREDWIECKLEQISTGKNGIVDGPFGSNLKTSDYVRKGHGTVPVLTTKNLAGNYDDDSVRFISQEKFLELKRSQVVPNDIIVAKIGSIGKNGIYPSNAPIAIIPANLLKFTVSDLVALKYVHYFIKTYGFQATLKKISTATAQPAFNVTKFRNLKIPLAAIPEQRAIVKKLESLFSSLDAGVADLKKAQQQLKIYRQAVLKKAFEGELTKEWRSKQNNLPGNDEILALAKNERSKYYHLQLNEWEEAVKDWKSLGSVDKKPIKPSKPKEFDAVKSDELEAYDLAEVVNNWSRIGNLTYKVGDIDHKMPSTVADGIPYLSTGNIGKNGGLDFENAKRISEVDYKRLALKIKPEKGDIIFPRYGTIGRNILIDIDKKFLVSYSCAIIKTLKEVYSPKFLLYYTLSPVIQKEIKRYTVETTQKNIGIASIEKFICPIYSLSEQQQIIKQIESRLSICDSIEQNIKESLEKAEALRQSILKKAFEGNLLTAQELAECKLAADYEPASVLLERIKAEQNKATAKTNKKR